jgi:dolichyl-phosphooligosaccharide-protein glycotransferase
MNLKKFFTKYRFILIIILLFLLAFSLRAQAVNINAVPAEMKSIYQDETGLPYFSEMDSYYNYRLTQNFLDHGILGDKIIDGVDWDLHSYYPPGRSADYPPLIVYVTSFVYKFLNIFTQIPLTAVAYWIGAFIASLAVIPAYTFIRRITNDYGGITAGILVGVSPIYFSHTFAGFFDTDMFTMLLPLLIVWLFVESILTDKIRLRILFAILSAVFLMLFALTWVGWWYIPYLLIATVIFYLISSHYIFKKESIQPFKDYPSKYEWFLNQKELFSLILFVIVSFILLDLSLGFTNFLNALLGPIGFSQLQQLVQTSTYPNVYISVSELQIPGLPDIISGVGGIIVFVLGILGLILLFWQLKESHDVGKTGEEEITEKLKEKEIHAHEDRKKRNRYLFMAILLTIWILITAYALTKGIRFISTFSLPIILSTGIFAGLGVKYLKNYIKNPIYCKITAIILIVLLVTPSVVSAYNISNTVVPGTNDYMVKSLEWINKNTPENTVITSWWDFGHLFTAKADRSVTFDGGSQNTPRAYWVGKALLTNNEQLSAGILRMLTSSGDLAYTTLDNYTGNTAKTVEILNNILGVDRTTAQSLLINKYKLNSKQAQTILKYTHPINPNPHLFITSEDMLGKAGWWSYFGSWDFNKLQGQQYLYIPGNAVSQSVNNTTIILSSDNNVVAQINGTKILAGIQVNQTQIIKPYKLIYIENKKIKNNELVSNESPITVVLIKDRNNYKTIAMSKELEDAMFTRLYILRGANLSIFKLAYEQPEVLVWKF